MTATPMATTRVTIDASSIYPFVLPDDTRTSLTAIPAPIKTLPR